MSSSLWKYYLENDVERFRLLLANTVFSNWPHSQKSNNAIGVSAPTPGSGYGSLGGVLASSPRANAKARKISSGNPATVSSSGKGPNQLPNSALTRADINSKDSAGMTILHHAASSTTEISVKFALALLEHPLIDLYVQDLENGWTALHRAVYFGNITTARAIIDRDTRDSLGQYNGGPLLSASGIIKIKDKEGFSPFDVLASTISYRVLDHKGSHILGSTQSDDADIESGNGDSASNFGDATDPKAVCPRVNIEGDEVFAFGSNKNITLGFGDGDDRQYPERITLRRPDHLLHRFYREYRFKKLKSKESTTFDAQHQMDVPAHRDVHSLPSLVRFRPILIQDVSLSKLHTAVLTTDPESNLYMCGFGPGGRLGTGDEITRFNFVCIECGLSGKKIINVGLGQNHSLAVDSEGGIFSWGSNNYGQLGYALPKTNVKDEELIQNMPRQIFGPLKREIVIGAAASRIHSVVHTSTSLYTFGKNEGQLGLVDSDAGSLEIQITPRKVGASRFSSPIRMVSAIDRATICLLQNHEVWVFANYGYTKMTFPLNGFTGYFLKKSIFTTRFTDASNHISKITSGGDTICAMSSTGDVFTVTVNQKLESGSTASTTNPTKIRNALSQPKRIWSLKKGHMAVRDVDVGQDGSVIICTDSGSVWKRVKRAKIKDTNAPGKGDAKAKDYKFSRVPRLTSVTAVRSNTFGAYAAVRRDCDVPKTQILIEKPKLWDDTRPLMSFKYLTVPPPKSHWGSELSGALTLSTDRQAGFHISSKDSTLHVHFDRVKSFVMSPDLEKDMSEAFSMAWSGTDLMYDLEVCSTVSDVVIPAHCFIFGGRSPVLRKALSELKTTQSVSIMGLISLDFGELGIARIKFQGLDFLTILNLVVYLYQDLLIDVWHFARLVPKSAFRFRQVRTELIKIAACLELSSLESAVRAMVQPAKTLCNDMENSITDPAFFGTGDAIVELVDTEVKVHSVLMCQRCPFFEGLFRGRAAGGWLSSRRELIANTSEAIKIDLKHIELSIFELVLRHIYADTGEELFDDVVTTDMDEFLDIVMDVLSVANELMLDRLSQICQKMLGRFVTTRNACQLLNAVAPCSVTEFKDALLEYLCLNLETMLENHLLDELDEDLLLELDQTVRANQLSCLPHAKSGRAEALLHERNPDLSEQINLERQAKIHYFNTQARMQEDENRLSSSLKGKGNDLDLLSSSPTAQKSRRRSGKDVNPSASPALRPKSSGADLMFYMDVEEGNISGSKGSLLSTKSELQPLFQPPLGFHEPDSPASSQTRPNVWLDVKGKPLSPDQQTPMPSECPVRSENPKLSMATLMRPSSSAAAGMTSQTTPARRWEASPLPSTKLGMKEIMEQASASRTSNISLGLSSQPKPEKLVRTKLSQKERKKQQHQAVQADAPKPPAAASTTPTATKGPASPWQSTSIGPKVSLKDILGVESNKSLDAVSHRLPVGLNPASTVAGPARNAYLMGRTPSSSGSLPKQEQATTVLAQTKAFAQSPNVPLNRRFPSNPTQSQPSTSGKSYKTPVQTIFRDSSSPRILVVAEPSLQLSMADIISQQQAEQEIIRGTVMKRSLQEIQQEQEFQSWWDAEEAKVKEAAEASARAQSGSPSRSGKGGGDGGSGRGRARGGGRGNPSQRGRGGRGRGGANVASAPLTENVS